MRAPSKKSEGALRQRVALSPYEHHEEGAPGSAFDDFHDEGAEDQESCCRRFSQWSQNLCYETMARTIWGSIIGGFRPARLRAIQAMDVQATDRILLVGEGAGADFSCLPTHTNWAALRAFDFSTEMVRQSKIEAARFGISEDHCFEGDAQRLPFMEEKFDKIFFPLSLASIPDPHRAMQEAERVLASGGKIIIFEKLLDDGEEISYSRYCVNFFTNATFADITRNLNHILGERSPLKITGYEAVDNQLDSVIARRVGQYYRIATVVREADYPMEPTVPGYAQ